MTIAWRQLPRASRRAALVGLIALVACAIGGVLQPQTFFASWLLTWLFVLAIALGGMMNVMIHELTGGRWGVLLRRPLEAAMLTLPLCALLALPLAFGLPSLFEWARPGAVAASDILQQKHWFQNVPGLLMRNAAWLVVWNMFAFALARRLGSARPADVRARHRLSVAGLLVYLATVTLFAYDWVASLVPDWNSTAVGLRVGTAQFVAAVAFAVGFVTLAPWLRAQPPRATARDFGDFGNLLLTVVMFWAYIAYTQYFIVWSEDLPHDASWYWPRVFTSWRWLAVGTLSLVFALPFVAMLFRAVKRNPTALGLVCVVALVGEWLDCAWLTLPSLRPRGFDLHWLDFVALIAQGALWLGAVIAIAERLPPTALAQTAQARAHG
jgi:hypothetical protein